MIQNKKLVLINNEKVSKKENKYYCHNIDMKSIPEGLSKYFEVYTIVRKSKKHLSHEICTRKINAASNIFTFLLNVFKTFKYKETDYLLISITPYTFFSYLLLFIFRKKTFIYLRSNGYEEYRAIFGLIGPLIYHFMYVTATFKSNIITCHKRLVKKKSDLVSPSQLNKQWFEKTKQASLDKPRLLYVGRIKVEKGIFSFLKIFKKIDFDTELSIVGNSNDIKKKQLKDEKKINFLGYGFDASKLIDIYDKHNIFILPSFTEAHPQVVDEALARGRPVIIFKEIEHIIQNRVGIFVSKRDSQSLSETIEFVIKNYLDIQKNMLKNKLPTKEEFILQITNILNKN